MQIQENMTAEYYQGVYDGVRIFAHWKGGNQYVGTCGTPLEKMKNEINEVANRSLKINV